MRFGLAFGGLLAFVRHVLGGSGGTGHGIHGLALRAVGTFGDQRHRGHVRFRFGFAGLAFLGGLVAARGRGRVLEDGVGGVRAEILLLQNPLRGVVEAHHGVVMHVPRPLGAHLTAGKREIGEDVPGLVPVACRAPSQRVAFDLRRGDGHVDQILDDVRTALLGGGDTFELFDGVLLLGLHRGGETAHQRFVEMVLFRHFGRGRPRADQLLDLRDRQRVVGLGHLLPGRLQPDLLGFENGSLQFVVHRDEELFAACDEYQVPGIGDMVQPGAPRRIISHAHTTFH